MVEIRDYLALVAKGKLPVNHQIMYHLQDVFNLLPDLDGQAEEARLKRRAFRSETNDQLMLVFLSSLVRSVLALHDLSESLVGFEVLVGEKTDVSLCVIS